MSDETGKEKKDVTIIVNGTPSQVPKGKISFAQLTSIAFDNNPPTGENVVITITYSKGASPQSGSLLAGQEVEDKDGMVFNVRATDKS